MFIGHACQAKLIDTIGPASINWIKFKLESEHADSKHAWHQRM